MRFSACARTARPHVPIRRTSACRTAPCGHRLDEGHAPPRLSPAGVPLPVSSHRTTRPGPVLPCPGDAPGVRPFAVLLPPAGVGASPPLGPTCRFSRRPVPFAAYVANGTGRPAPSHPLSARGHGRPRARAAAPGLRPRGRSVPAIVRHGEVGARRVSIPPWAFPLSGLRTPALGTAWHSLPLVGFADVPDVMRPAKLPRATAPYAFGRGRAEWP